MIKYIKIVIVTIILIMIENQINNKIFYSIGPCIEEVPLQV
jgi:hypothetical protein